MILAFVYDFPHFKSAQGLFALKRAGYEDVIAIGAPWKKLNIAESHFQFKTPGMADAHHPKEACEALGYRYYVGEHDGELAEMMADEADKGLILGARILKPNVLSRTEIINLHPGVLPLNRGLDTLKWAVHDKLPQAITAHVIDAKIDRGRFIKESIVDVYPEDSYADIYNRMMWKQISMIESVMKAPSGFELGEGIYRRPMTLEQDVLTKAFFSAYKHDYAGIVSDWQGERDAA